MAKNQSKYIVFQVLLWSGVWLCILLLLGSKNELDAYFWRQTIITVAGIALVVFVNLKWLLPNFYFKKKRVLYVFLCSALLMTVAWGIHSDVLPWNQKDKFRIEERHEKVYGDQKNQQYDQNDTINIRWLVRNLPPLFICLLGSSLFSLSRFANQKEKEAIQLEKNNLETEIKFLKSQINPHFLFNSLHNIYALTIINSEQASNQLLKLSDILRYMLYDSNEETVALEREVEYLKNYLGLAQLKDSRGMDLSFEVDVERMNLKVAPLLFIPFVENAFKHSQIEDLQNGYIHIALKTRGQHLSFTVDNSKPKNPYKKDEVGGVGLSNIKQRLKLLYPEKYSLQVEEAEKSFKITLELNCK